MEIESLRKQVDSENLNFAKLIIRDYMKKNKIDTVDELLKESPDLQSFIQNSKYENCVSRINFRYELHSNDAYEKIIEQLKIDEAKKKSIDIDDIQKNTINGHEVATVTDKKSGKQVTFDNTYTNRSIENQMEDVQNDHSQFQSVDENNNNTEGVIKYMEKNVKITPDTVKSNELKKDYDDEEQQIAIAIKIFESDIGHPVEVDLNSKIIYDRYDSNIYSIEKRDGKYQIIDQNNEKKKEKGKQMVMKNNTSNAA